MVGTDEPILWSGSYPAPQKIEIIKQWIKEGAKLDTGITPKSDILRELRVRWKPPPSSQERLPQRCSYRPPSGPALHSAISQMLSSGFLKTLAARIPKMVPTRLVRGRLSGLPGKR